MRTDETETTVANASKRKMRVKNPNSDATSLFLVLPHDAPDFFVGLKLLTQT
jgi:hypothetical protein